MEVTTEPAFVLSAPNVLFDEPNYSRIQNFGLARTWDIHPDGSHFIMVASEGGESGTAGAGLTEVYLVVNWFEELRERMGKLKAQIPWLRVFVEGVVIVGSIRASPSGAWASSPWP